MDAILIAIGSIFDGKRWFSGPNFSSGPQASQFKFVVRKKSSAEWINENKTRFRLLKEDVARSLIDQAELGVVVGGIKPENLYTKTGDSRDLTDSGMQLLDSMVEDIREYDDDADMNAMEAQILQELDLGDDDEIWG